MLKERCNLHGVLYKDLDPSLQVVLQRHLGQIMILKISWEDLRVTFLKEN